MATFLGDIDEAGGQLAPDADVLAASAAVEEEKAEPRRIAGSALVAKMLAPEASPLLTELSEASTGLEDGYYRRVYPAQSIRTTDPRRVRFRATPWLCDAVGLPSPLSDKDLIKCFGTWDARPMPRLSMAYMGYQFGVLNKGLGDGRAFVWGQWHNQPAPALSAVASFPELWEMGTKGSGKTPFSRGHDGLLTLQGAVREAIGTEALGAAGVRTTRVLAIIETEVGASMLNERECLQPQSRYCCAHDARAGPGGGLAWHTCCRLRRGGAGQICAVVRAFRIVRTVAASRFNNGRATRADCNSRKLLPATLLPRAAS